AEEVGMSGPGGFEKGAVREHRDSDGVPLIDDASDWRRGAGVLVTTARAFKGLEADIVIVYGLGSFGPLFTVTDLYVAWTRARHRLILVCQSGEIRASVEAALADAERAASVDASA